MWGFDGSSTRQAEGRNSDCMLKPVAVYPDPTKKNGALVMCEVLMPDGTPHPSNSRATIPDDPGTWFGFEQEYFLYKDGAPLGFPREGFPAAAGRVLHRRRLQERRRHRPRDRGHAPRPLPRRRHQPRGHQRRGGQGPVGVPDLRQGLEERRRRGLGRPLPPAAPLRKIPRRRELPSEAARQGVDWNGSGMHTNFSTKYLREVGGKEYFEALMAAFDKYKDEHIAVYGPDNHLRLTGLHETQAIDKFNYGVANRGASVRVPHSFIEQRLPRLPGRPPAELAGRPVPDRRPHPADDRDGADRGRGGRLRTSGRGGRGLAGQSGLPRDSSPGQAPT